jgi:uncharacterized membrane protein YjfL (UPF0719 family)
MLDLISLKNIISVFLFSGIGMAVLAVSFIIFDRITPGNLWKEIVEEHNVALAITTGAMTIGMAMIIAAAIHS